MKLLFIFIFKFLFSVILTFMLKGQNPLIFSIQLMCFSLIMSLNFFNFMNYMLFSFLFCMVYVSGVLIFFSYMTSFIANKKLVPINTMDLILIFFYYYMFMTMNYTSISYYTVFSNYMYMYLFFILLIFLFFIMILMYMISLKKNPIRLL